MGHPGSEPGHERSGPPSTDCYCTLIVTDALVNPQRVAETLVDCPVAGASTVPTPAEMDEKTAVLEMFQVT